MDRVGEIVARTGGERLHKQAWIDLIDRHPGLARPEARTMINPFNRQPMTVNPNPSYARVIGTGGDVGSLEWFQDGQDGIVVWADADPELVIPVAENVARALGAEFRRAQSENA
jgi:hypothetical protein